MNFNLSDEHEAFRLVVRDFAEKEIAPHAAMWDEKEIFPLDAVAKMAELGLFGLVFPEEWGGGDGDFVSLCIAIEELGRVDQSIGITLSAGGQIAFTSGTLPAAVTTPVRIETAADAIYATVMTAATITDGTVLTFLIAYRSK